MNCLPKQMRLCRPALFPKRRCLILARQETIKRMQSGVRKLAGKAGIVLEELREPNRCCGYGGHMRIANPELYDEITQHRAEASDKPYIVYCANCREVFASRGKECAHILDMVFGLGVQDPGCPACRKRGTTA